MSVEKVLGQDGDVPSRKTVDIRERGMGGSRINT